MPRAGPCRGATSGPRWRSMVTSLSPTGARPHQRRVPRVLAVPAGRLSTADSAGVRLVFDLGTRQRGRPRPRARQLHRQRRGHASTPAGSTSARAGSTPSARDGRHLQRRGRRHRHPGRPARLRSERDDRLSRSSQLPLCERVLSSDGAGLSLGRPEQPLHQRQRRARHRGPERRQRPQPHRAQRERLPLRGGSRSRQLLSSATASPRRTPRATSPRGSSTGFRSASRPTRINTPTLRAGPASPRSPSWRRPTPGQPDIVARFAMARLRFVGSPWVRRSETPIAGLTGATGKPHGEVDHLGRLHRERDRPGIRLAAGRVRDVARRGGDQQRRAPRSTRSRSGSSRRDLRLGERAEAYLRFPAGAQNLLTYRTLRVWMRGRGPGWEEGDLQAFIKLGSDNDNFYLYRAPAHSTTWEPELVDRSRDAGGGCAPTWRIAGCSGQPPSGAADVRDRLDTDAYVACEGPYLVHVARPGDQSAQPRRGAGDLGRHLPGGRRRSRTPESELWVDDIRLSQSGLPDRHGGVVRRAARRLRRRQRVASRTSSRTGSSGRSTRTRPTAAPTCSSWRATVAARSLPAHRARPRGAADGHLRADRRSTRELLTGTDLRGRGAARAAEARIAGARPYACRSPAELPGNRLAHPRPARPAGRSPRRTPRGNATTEYSEAQAQLATRSTLTYQLQMRRRGFRLPLGGLVNGLPKFMREGETGQAPARGRT